MKRMFLTLTLLASVQLISDQEGLARAAFDLAEQGRPACSIVLAESHTPAVRLAALELQCHVMKITGAELPIRSESEQVEGRRILVGESSMTRRFGLRGGDFEPQEYLIAFRPDTIILIGRDWEPSLARQKNGLGPRQRNKESPYGVAWSGSGCARVASSIWPQRDRTGNDPRGAN